MLPLLFAVLARPEEEWMARVAAGDERALKQLFDRCAPVALALCLRILHSRGEAEDTTQEALVEAWRRAASFDPRRGSGLSFVLAIARSRALDRLRARGAAQRAAESAAREDREPPPQPLESAEGRQERERMQAALAQLPPEQRAVLDLAYFEGLTQREIAERTGDPLGTVKTRCRLALEKLAAILGERP